MNRYSLFLSAFVILIAFAQTPPAPLPVVRGFTDAEAQQR
ncbi:MAG: hypothetical protein OHK0021_00070 [Bryobacter sp.]